MAVITTKAEHFLEAVKPGTDGKTPGRAVMKAALLVSPEGFRLSRESAADNAYMKPGLPLDLGQAARQHAALATKLEELGVTVHLFDGIDGQDDGVFPNNVFATVSGRAVVGSMRHPVRQKEAGREDIRDFFKSSLGYELIDLSGESCIAELTGPLVIDRARNIGFCGMSSRVDEAGCELMAEALRLDAVLRFDLAEGEYHANMILGLAAGKLCLVHPGSAPNPFLLKSIRTIYRDKVLVLNQAEKDAFAGNCIAATESDLLFSRTAGNSLREGSRQSLEDWGFRIHFLDVSEFEKAGGSVRCLIAEIY
ncbi:MAG: arginine deiminase-related protein [Planctomycetota bacterium]|nr:arginine deiminase-related protein [Planctomycetota bacterium]